MNSQTFRKIVRNIIENEIAIEKPEEQNDQWQNQEIEIVNSIELLNNIIETKQLEILITDSYSQRTKEGLLRLLKNLKDWDNEYNNSSPFNNGATNNEVPLRIATSGYSTNIY